MIRLEQAFGWVPGTAANLTIEQLGLYLQHSIPVNMLGEMWSIGRGAKHIPRGDDTARFEAAVNKHGNLDGAIKELAGGNL